MNGAGALRPSRVCGEAIETEDHTMATPPTTISINTTPASHNTSHASGVGSRERHRYIPVSLGIKGTLVGMAASLLLTHAEYRMIRIPNANSDFLAARIQPVDNPHAEDAGGGDVIE
jgi:hypothetical protein